MHTFSLFATVFALASTVAAKPVNSTAPPKQDNFAMFPKPFNFTAPPPRPINYTSDGKPINSTTTPPIIPVHLVGVPVLAGLPEGQGQGQGQGHRHRHRDVQASEKQNQHQHQARAVQPVSPVPSNYAATALNHHNTHRKNHSAPALIYNTKLASYSSAVAATCVWGHNLLPGGGGYGQNIAAMGASGEVAALDPSYVLSVAITTQWYNSEVRAFLPSYYGQATPDLTSFAAWGHFTQVVWKSSSSVGCATQFCPAGTIFPSMASWYTVCDYAAPGNVVGGFGANVAKSIGMASTYA